MNEATTKPLAHMKMTEWYDSTLYHELHHEFAAGSDYANYGYWDENTTTYQQACENLVLRLLDWIPEKTGKILDVGCGKGETTRCLTRFYSPACITGINISERQLGTAREKVPEATFRFMDATQLDFPDATFDAVISVEAAFHFQTREVFLEEAFRVLKPGGWLVLSDMLMTREAEDRRPWHYLENYLESPAAYQALLERIGFRQCRVEDEMERTWNQVFRFVVRFLHEKFLQKEISRAFMEGVLATNYLIVEDLLSYLLVAARKP